MRLLAVIKDPANGAQPALGAWPAISLWVGRPRYRAARQAGVMNALTTGALMAGFVHLEKKHFRQFQRILHESDPVYDSSPQAILSEYNVSVVHTGEAMAHEIERKTGVPMVCVTYDGTGGTKNEVILPYLEYPRAPSVVRCQVPA